jgi:uncharacterized repeat protein (TIGR03843 family)
MSQVMDPRLLREGEMEVVGRITEASNLTLYCSLRLACPDPEPPLEGSCVYKPIRGERPLEDFPRHTLAKREVAAHAVSEAGGWGIVPLTLLRDGPLGPGMVQQWIEVDESVDPVEMVFTGDPRLRAMAVLDLVINNADRKIGHLLPLEDGRILGVDHGVCFSPYPKLRTVLWAWRGARVEDEELRPVERVLSGLDGPLGERLGTLLSRREVGATRARAERLLEERRFPVPDPSRPAIPWPPF